MNTVVLISTQGGEPVMLTKEAASASEYLRNKQGHVPLTFSRSVLQKVAAYLMYHKDNVSIAIPKPLPDGSFRGIVGDWDDDFLYGLQAWQLCALREAAVFLGLESLDDLAAAKIASECLDRKPAQIIKWFAVKPPSNTPTSSLS